MHCRAIVSVPLVTLDPAVIEAKCSSFGRIFQSSNNKPPYLYRVL